MEFNIGKCITNDGAMDVADQQDYTYNKDYSVPLSHHMLLLPTPG